MGSGSAQVQCLVAFPGGSGPLWLKCQQGPFWVPWVAWVFQESPGDLTPLLLACLPRLDRENPGDLQD